MCKKTKKNKNNVEYLQHNDTSLARVIMSKCQEVSSCRCTPSWQSIMRKVTWRRFDQSAKQLVVGQTTTSAVSYHGESCSVAWLRPAAVVIWLHDLIQYTHTRLMSLCPGLPRWAGTRKVKPIWILLKQETVSGSGISWAICKSAPRSRQITMPAPHHSGFYRPDALPAAQPTASRHWKQEGTIQYKIIF